MGSVDNGIPTRSCEVEKLARKEEMLMRKKKPFEKCPICGGELEEKEVEKLLHGGVHTAIMKVRAEVCLHCGERLYSQEVVRRFEDVRRKLEREEVSAFKLRGKAFQVA
jgi:YgiT-type zinc finger domain-containing protein